MANISRKNVDTVTRVKKIKNFIGSTFTDKKNDEPSKPKPVLKPLKNIEDKPTLEVVTEETIQKPKIKVPKLDPQLKGINPINYIGTEPEHENNFWFYLAFALILVAAITIAFLIFTNKP